MRLVFVRVAAAMILAMAASPSMAANQFYCTVSDYNGDKVLAISEVMTTSVAKIDEMRTGFAYSDQLKKEGVNFPGSIRVGCSQSTNGSYLVKERQRSIAQNPTARLLVFRNPPVPTTPYRDEGLVVSAGSISKSNTPSQTKPTQKPEKEIAKAPATPPVTSEYGVPQSAEKKAKYEAELAAYNRKLAQQAAAEKAKRDQLEANKRNAQAAQNEYAAKQEAHRRELALAALRRQQYEAELFRNQRCRQGDRQACDDIAAGRPALAANTAIDVGKAASAGKPKTSDDDARSCVSTPVVAPTSTKGQIAARVTNTCKSPVDVRICLMRAGGWNCGATWGLRPQEGWSHSSFQANGEIEWDARMTGESRPLGGPKDGAR